MPIILREEIGNKECWACGFPIESEKPTVTLTAAMTIIFLHPKCAQRVARQLNQDWSQLVELGYNAEEESWEPD